MPIGSCAVLDCDEQAAGAVDLLPRDHDYKNPHGDPVVYKLSMCARHHQAVTVDNAPWRYDEEDGTIIVRT